ncbi:MULTISPECIES: efflux RND transporter periplasmic adaptor subunit [unclassified Neisseria]|uniref:efflux RND transporter periplasmic adaptor subunit n=1 Tax=unclassified Neisseria TaxID=2623750 RepID=UPI002664EC71|nr:MULTISPECIES: efflux RND transporter periplasmic adaptor subunit [unclassified Neisseria]MDO1510177.1 efflux RND transporter periplasmic adaptor subunit [Neisseria sp. MVDL19-042950]MDO1516753.1 efflux RND transporter periplasmic adaptor subunit [Neisseria sp. MVDL18-041461]MDO1563900.1 efflux RND transporter periplasmic adaptor subunit [Neisseria sp. MVDL20-010259]
MAKTIKWFILLAAAAIVVFAAWSYFKSDEKINYLTQSASRMDIRQTVSATGEISAAQLVAVGSQASGQIKKLHVKLGQQVKKGDLIAEIDSTTQLNALNTNKAKLDTYKAQLHSAEIKQRTAEKKYKREKALWAENATSKAEFEDAEDMLAAAKASVAELKSLIRQTQIAINTAEADLGYTLISSPIDGTVVSIPVEEGQTVNANQTTPTIVQVADLSKMLNKMQIAEGDANKVKAGQTLMFTTLSMPDNSRKAVIDTVDPGLTTMSNGSYTTSTDTTDTAIYYYARALVPNEDGALHIGMTTENTIVINQAEKVLSVPNLAVKTKDGKKTVRILGDKDQVQERAVKTGLSDGTNIQITEGVKEGEKVIISESTADDIDAAGRKMGKR